MKVLVVDDEIRNAELTALALREAGFEARYMKGGHSAWKAIGGPVKMYA